MHALAPPAPLLAVALVCGRLFLVHASHAIKVLVLPAKLRLQGAQWYRAQSRAPPMQHEHTHVHAGRRGMRDGAAHTAQPPTRNQQKSKQGNEHGVQ